MVIALDQTTVIIVMLLIQINKSHNKQRLQGAYGAGRPNLRFGRPSFGRYALAGESD